MQLAERAARRREEFGVPALAIAVIRSDGIDTAVVGRRRLNADDPARKATGSTSARTRKH